MLRLVALLILILNWSAPASSQQRNKVDAGIMRRLLKEQQPDTNSLLILDQLGLYYLYKNPAHQLDSAGYYFQQAKKLIDKLPDVPLKYTINNLKSRAQLEDKKKNIAGARKLMLDAINLQKLYKDKNGEAETWSNLAVMLLLQEKFTDFAEQIDSINKVSYELYRQTGNRTKQIESKFRILEYLHLTGRNEEAEREALKVLSQYRKTPVSYFSDLYCLISKANRYRGNFNRSLYYSLKSIETMAQTKDYSREGNFYGELAQVYQELGQRENSIYWYRKTIRAREKTTLPQRYLFRTAGFLAHELIAQKRPKEALNEILALESRHQPDNQVNVGTLSQIKAYCYEAMGQSKLAEYHYLKMIHLYEKNTFRELLAIARFDLANFYVNQGRYKKARPYMAGFYQGVALVSKQKDFELLAFKIDSAAGRYLQAINHIRKYETLKDSIFSSEKSKQIQELQIRYQTARNEQSIKLLKKDSLLSASRIRDANNLRNMTLIGLVILILFLALLYFSYRSKQRSNVEINNKNLWLNQLVEEKEWLIKEVHHRVKNNLQIVMGLLQRQSAYIDNEKAFAAIQNSEHRMHSIALIHQKLYQSESMALINMPEYVDELISYLKDSFDTGSRIHFYREIENFSLDVQHAVPLGLILNEAITNAIKYAFGNSGNGDIRVEISTANDENFILQITDNGIGLPAGFDLKTVNSLGMNLMRGLAKQLGGKLTIEDNQGVTIQVIFKKNKLIPLNRKNRQQESYG